MINSIVLWSFFIRYYRCGKGVDLCQTCLFRKKLPMPTDLRSPRQTPWVQVGHDLQAEESREDVGEIQVTKRHVICEPILDETILGSSALQENLPQELLPL